MNPHHSPTDTSGHGLFARWRARLAHGFVLQLTGLLLAMGLLPLLSHYLTSNQTTENTILDLASRQNLAMLGNQRDYLHLQMEQIEDLAANMGQVDEIAEVLSNVGTLDTAASSYDALVTNARLGYLLSNYKNMKGLVSIDLFALNGKHYHVGETLSRTEVRTALRDQLLARTMEANTSVVWHGVQPNVQALSDTPLVVAATKLIVRPDASWLKSEPVGMLLINYSTEVLHQHLSQIDLGLDAYMLVVDSAQHLIYHPSKALIGQPLSPAFGQLLQGPSGTFLQQLGPSQVLLSYEKLTDVGWYVVSIVPKDALLAPMQKIRRAGKVMLLLSVLLVGLLVWQFVVRIARPIDAISAGFKQFQNHQLPTGWRMSAPASLASIRGLVGWFNVFLDTMEKRRDADAKLRIAATVFESQEGMLVTDAQHRILQVNGAFTQITGYNAQEVVGQTPALLKSGRHDEAFYRAMRQALQQTGSWEGEVWNRRKDGTVYPEWLTITSVCNEAGEVTHFVATQTDITLRKASEEKIKQLAFYDALTQLPNRRLLHDRLQQATLSTARTGLHGALMFLDLDKFKTLNDTLGHDKGDILLQQAGQRLSGCVRTCDTVARLGWDEFVVLLEQLSTLPQEAAAEAKLVGHKILLALDQPYDLNGTEYRCTSSIGITLVDAQRPSLEDLMKQADMAMYQAKESGRNTLRFFDPQMQALVIARAQMEASMQQGLLDHAFRIYFQPQLDRDARITGAEVLVRWNHDQLGLIPPSEFIAIAEESGLILPLGLWILEATCTQIQIWSDHPTRHALRLSVNVSARQFRQPQFVQTVLDVLARTGIAPHKLKLELTESMLISDMPDVIHKMAQLKAHGLSFSLDDFGTGYSSLAYLKQLPLDQLKIDQSFVRDVLIDPNDATLARTVIALGQSMGMEVVAEGVEEQGQHDFLLAHGCNAFQGYLYSRPLTLDAFEQFTNEHPLAPDIGRQPVFVRKKINV